MAYSLSIGGSSAIVSARRKRFRLLYGFNLALQSVIALVAIFCPIWLGAQMGMDLAGIAGDWVRIWGAMVIIASLFQVSGYMEPIENRLAVMIGIIARALMVVVYIVLGGPFLGMAAFDGIFGLIILILFQSLIKAEVMSRP
jgi:hypothetical protein